MSNSASGTWTRNYADDPCNFSHRLYCFSNLVTVVQELFVDDFEDGDLGSWDAHSP
jgi:hypothetical protein